MHKKLTQLALLLILSFAAAQPVMYVSSSFTEQVLMYDLSGNFLGSVSNTPIKLPYGLMLDEQGDLLVSSSGGGNAVMLVSARGRDKPYPYLRANGLTTPDALRKGPDGLLYVTLHEPGQVMRFDTLTGKSLGIFVDGKANGLVGASGLDFGPDGDLYVASYDSDQVLRFDSKTGAFKDIFAKVDDPGGLEFGRNGNLYVADGNRNAILKFEAKTGMLLEVFSKGGHLNGPWGIAFGPDGNLYVANYLGNNVEVFDGRTGAFLKSFAGEGRVKGPTYITFGEQQPNTPK